MPPKRAPKAPPAPKRSPAKKAPRPAATKKKQAPPKPDAKKKVEPQPPNVQKPKRPPAKVTQQLLYLLRNPSASARSIVDFIVGATCGLESLHNWSYLYDATPFLLAAEANRLDVAQLLVAEHSVDTKALARGNVTALHIASWAGHLEMARWLVEQCGLDVHAVNVYGLSSLQCAINCRHSDAALMLLEVGADPNFSGTNKWTPLHYACMRGLVDVARALIAKGASPGAANNEGKTPLDIAVHWEHHRVAALFEASA